MPPSAPDRPRAAARGPAPSASASTTGSAAAPGSPDATGPRSPAPARAGVVEMRDEGGRRVGYIRRPRVVVFGGGIGGMTVAHELGERGFSVDVYEKEGPEHAGGLAASQWHESLRAPAMWHEVHGKTPPWDCLTLPGEHGFRFFPSFYQHVIDTMKRIPIWERPRLRDPADVTDYATHTATERDFFRPPMSVADNLVPTHKVAYALEDGFRILVFDRRQPRSGLAIFTSMMMWLAGMGYELRDMALMGAKVWQYLTSCRERRLDQYQKVSFWDFIEGGQFSPRFQRHVQRLIRVLVAMDAHRADARTVLNVLVRMILDQNTSGAETDRVLNGPTSERWLAPWRHYLENHLGVRFHWRHTLQRFELDPGKRKIARAVVAGPEGTVSLDANANLDAADGVKYFVVDLPVRALAQVVAASDGLAEADEREVREQPPRDFPRENPDPPLSSIALLADPIANPRMSGIQFYLSDPLQILPGHVMFIDSKWGLSAVVQTQFWGDDFAYRYGEHTVRAILSVDLTDFETKGEITGRSLNEIIDAVGAGTLTPAQASDEIAVEVWRQMSDGLRQWEIDFPRPDEYVGARSNVTFPIPPPYVDHHIDAHLGFPCGGCPDAPLGRALGYFVSPPDTWGARPGPLPSYIDNERGYRIRLGNLAVAGVFAQTFTSLNSMEAANESARHAANGILNHAERHLLPHEPGKRRAYRFEKCSIWPMEEAEPGDLVWWKQIDERLWRKGDPHMIEILGTARFVERFMKVCNVKNEANTPEKFHRLYEDLFAWISAFGRFSPF